MDQNCHFGTYLKLNERQGTDSYIKQQGSIQKVRKIYVALVVG